MIPAELIQIYYHGPSRKLGPSDNSLQPAFKSSYQYLFAVLLSSNTQTEMSSLILLDKYLH